MIESDIHAIYEAIGKRIQEIRAGKRITQATIAAQVGLTRQSVANIEHGRQRFMVHTLLSIAQVLEITPEDLLPDQTRRVESIIDKQLLDSVSPAKKRLVLSIFQPQGQN